MACRGLAPRQRLWGMVIGAGIAVVLLIIIHGHRRKADGAALSEAGRRNCAARDRSQAAGARDRRARTASRGTSLWHAIRIVVIADIVMSLDNVIAVAAAANGSFRC